MLSFRPHLAALMCVSLLLAACASPTPTPTPSATSPPATPTPAASLRLIVAASEVLVGQNRILLAITDADGVPVEGGEVKLRFTPSGPGVQGTPMESAARHLGGAGPEAKALYSTRVAFDAPGEWAATATVAVSGKPTETAAATLIVRPRGNVPAVGQPAPLSRQKTTRDVPVEQLTSQRPVADPSFYEMTIAEAIQSGKPLLVVFGTPAFCTTRTCGPQLEVAQAVKARHGGRMHFLHVEIYQRPDLMLEGKTPFDINPAVLEWKLPSDPWVFLIDAHGKVADRFEGYASEAELEEAVRRVLGA